MKQFPHGTIFLHHTEEPKDEGTVIKTGCMTISVNGICIEIVYTFSLYIFQEKAVCLWALPTFVWPFSEDIIGQSISERNSDCRRKELPR